MPEQSSPIRVGIVGTGVGIRTYLPSIACNPALTLTGIVGSSVERAQAHLSAAGESVAIACEWEDLLATEPDLICITTPVAERFQYIADLREYRGSVLVEKPVVTRKEDGDVLLEALGRRVERTYTDFQLRGAEVFRFARSLISEGRLGQLYDIALFERNAGLRCSCVPGWMRNRSTGGGQMFSMGSHLLDLAVFLTGAAYDDVLASPVVSAEVEAPRRSWVPDADMSADADEVFRCSLQLDRIRVTILTTAIGRGPRALELRMEGTEGCLEFGYVDGVGELSIWLADGSNDIFAVGADASLASQRRDIVPLNPSFFRLAHSPYLDLIVRAVRGESGLGVASLMDGIHNAACLEAAIE